MIGNNHDKDYIVGNYLIGAAHYSVHYRATTNNDEVYNEIVANLPWRDTCEEAQADLDRVAQEQGWDRWNPDFHSSWEI